MADEPPEDRRNGPAGDGARDGPQEDRESERSAGEAPLADLAERVRRRRAAGDDVRGQSPAPDGREGPEDGPFVRAEPFDGTASEHLRQSLGEPSTAPAAEPAEAPDEHVVSKRAYCESCEHFGAPPAVSCEHPGTTIVEFPDADHVRVRDCPVVAERQETGEAREPGRRQGPFGRQ